MCGYNTRNLADVVMTTFVIIFQLYLVMTTPCLVLYYILVAYNNIHFFRSGSSKKTIFLNFDHFLPTVWLPNSGHWHKKCVQKYTMVLFGTIDFWDIKTYNFWCTVLIRIIEYLRPHAHAHYLMTVWNVYGGQNEKLLSILELPDIKK